MALAAARPYAVFARHGDAPAEDDMHIGWIALVASAWLGSPGAEADVLVDQLATCHSLTDRGCLLTAARLGGLREAALAPIERRMRELPREAQVLALGVIDRIPDRAASDLLAEIAGDRRLDPAVRALAIEAIGARHHPRVVQIFTRATRDKVPVVRAAATRGLANHLYANDRRVLPALITMARDREASVRLEAIYGLGFSGNARAGKPLAMALEDPSPEVRRAATEGLGLVKYAKAAPLLVALLEDPDDLLVKAALRALKFQTGEDLGDNPKRWQRWLNER